MKPYSFPCNCFTLQTIPAWEEDDRFAQVAKVAGFSLHAGVAAQAWERQKLERLCRYISRPAVSEKRLSLTQPSGNIRYQLKTPCNEGTTHAIFEPLDFMYRMYGMPWAQGCAGAVIARLAALVPEPRVNLTRFHGVFAPNSKHRVLVTAAKRGKGNKAKALDEPLTPAERRASMTWAAMAISLIPAVKLKYPVHRRLALVVSVLEEKWI